MPEVLEPSPSKPNLRAQCVTWPKRIREAPKALNVDAGALSDEVNEEYGALGLSSRRKCTLDRLDVYAFCACQFVEPIRWIQLTREEAPQNECNLINCPRTSPRSGSCGLVPD